MFSQWSSMNIWPRWFKAKSDNSQDWQPYKKRFRSRWFSTPLQIREAGFQQRAALLNSNLLFLLDSKSARQTSTVLALMGLYWGRRKLFDSRGRVWNIQTFEGAFTPSCANPNNVNHKYPCVGIRTKAMRIPKFHETDKVRMMDSERSSQCSHVY